MSQGFFVAGTDTGVGKTLISSALLYAFARQGKKAVGMKPVAAGCLATPQGVRCEDADCLRASSNVQAPQDLINPYALLPPIAPHIAAEREGVEIDLGRIASNCRALLAMSDVLVVEGVGGFMVPLNSSQDTADLAVLLGLPVILVVGMRLGCINHALLSAWAIRQKGLRLAAWVANGIDPAMAAYDENLRALDERLAAPMLGAVPHAEQAAPDFVAGFLDQKVLDAERDVL
ncbi:MAG: dethiobiotin synthase [Burkholderiales bacterium]